MSNTPKMTVAQYADLRPLAADVHIRLDDDPTIARLRAGGFALPVGHNQSKLQDSQRQGTIVKLGPNCDGQVAVGDHCWFLRFAADSRIARRKRIPPSESTREGEHLRVGDDEMVIVGQGNVVMTEASCSST